MAEKKQQPKHPIKSRTNQFNAATLVLYPLVLALVRAGFTYFNIELDNETAQLFTQAIIAAIPIVLDNLKLRSITTTPVDSWFNTQPVKDKPSDA